MHPQSASLFFFFLLHHLDLSSSISFVQARTDCSGKCGAAAGGADKPCAALGRRPSFSSLTSGRSHCFYTCKALSIFIRMQVFPCFLPIARYSVNSLIDGGGTNVEASSLFPLTAREKDRVLEGTIPYEGCGQLFSSFLAQLTIETLDTYTVVPVHVSMCCPP